MDIARQASLSITNSQSLPNSCPSSQWCYPTISSSVDPFSSCPQSFPASRSYQMSQIFASGGQIIGVSASTSVLPINTQDWSPLGWTGWISLQSKGLSRVFSILIFLPAIFWNPIPACASSSPEFLMMYSAYKLSKQGDNIQPWRTPSPIWNQSVVPCPVLTFAALR